MKTFSAIFSRRVIAALAFIAVMVTSCVYLDDVTYPEQLVAGEQATFTLDVRVEPQQDLTGEKLIVAVLMPASWNAATNVTMSYTSDFPDETGVQTMSVIPADVLPANGGGATWTQHLQNKFGVGPNVNTNMQWVAFQSDKSYNVVDDAVITATVTVTALVGTENLQAQLGFFINNSGDGLSEDTARWKVEYSDCMPVTGATGDMVNYCETTAGVTPVAGKVANAAYPNPFTENFNVPLQLPVGTAYQMVLTDVTGKEVHKVKGTTASDNQVINLDAAQLRSGIYMVSVTSDKGYTAFKIVKN